MCEKRKSSSSLLSYFKKSNNSINDQNDIDETSLPSTFCTVFTPLTDSLEPSSSKNLTHPASNNDTEIII